MLTFTNIRLDGGGRNQGKDVALVREYRIGSATLTHGPPFLRI